MLWSMVLHLALSFKGGLGVVASFALFSFWAGECSQWLFEQFFVMASFSVLRFHLYIALRGSGRMEQNVLLDL